ncbi:protein kinase, partial [Streptomyces aureus]|uniref:protein kinase n=1 Tax=Streptomyces aureus TaxID=193461 RepID=UPI0020B1502D
MDDYAGRVLADRYRLPLPPADADADTDAYDPAGTRAFDTFSGQEVLVRQVPLPEFVDAEVLDGEGGPAGPYGAAGRATRRPAEPVVRRAIEAAQAAAQIPDHPLLDQVFDVFAEAGSLWIVSERIAARPLAALLAERPLNPYRAAEIGADVLTALRALHAHGWVHRNITARTVLVCDDGRVVLTGLAVGAAEEALCGYAPVPESDPEATAWQAPVEEYGSELYEAEVYEESDGHVPYGTDEFEEPTEDPAEDPAEELVDELLYGTAEEPEEQPGPDRGYGYGHSHDHGVEVYVAESAPYVAEPDPYVPESDPYVHEPDPHDPEPDPYDPEPDPYDP